MCFQQYKQSKKEHDRQMMMDEFYVDINGNDMI